MMDPQRQHDTENTALRRPVATAPTGDAPLPLAESIMVFGVLLVALGSGLKLYGPFLLQMFQVMFRSLFGGR